MYEPTEWQSGDIVTAEKLNKLENGVAGAVLVVTGTYDEQTDFTTLDKTWQEIYDAPLAVVRTEDSGETGTDIVIYLENTEANKYIVNTIGNNTFFATSPDGTLTDQLPLG